ncbi:nuclear transport factor 2 family protein [Salmonirosea aquatica]
MFRIEHYKIIFFLIKFCKSMGAASWHSLYKYSIAYATFPTPIAMKKLLTTTLLLTVLSTGFAQDVSEELTAVRQACCDYIDAFYRADTTLAYRSIHPSLQKRGFSYSARDNTYSRQLEMPFPALVGLARVWNKDGKRTNEASPREVEVFEVADKTASARVKAVWGIDYIHLKKEDGRWYIVNVLWQSSPKSAHRSQ